MSEYQVIGTPAAIPTDDSLGDAVFDSLPPGPAGPQAVPAATEADFDSLPPGPAGPQAVPVGIPPGPAGPQAVPVQQFTTTTSSPAHSTPPPSSAPSTPVPQHTQQVVGAGHQIQQHPQAHTMHSHQQPHYVQQQQQVNPQGNVQYVYVQQQQQQQQGFQQPQYQQPPQQQQPQYQQQQQVLIQQPGQPAPQYAQQQPLYSQQQTPQQPGHPQPPPQYQIVQQQPPHPQQQPVLVRQPQQPQHPQQQQVIHYRQAHPAGAPRHPSVRYAIAPQQPQPGQPRYAAAGGGPQQQGWTGGGQPQQPPRPMPMHGQPGQQVRVVQLKPGEAIRHGQPGQMQSQMRPIGQRPVHQFQRMPGGQPVRVIYQQPPGGGPRFAGAGPPGHPQVIRPGFAPRPQGQAPPPSSGAAGVRPGHHVIHRPPGPPGQGPNDPTKSQEIAYEVEHVFNENGKEVRKMPIKMGTSTYWVDVVDKKPEVPEDGFVMDFNMDDDTSSTASQQSSQNSMPVGGLQCPPRPNVTDALKKQIVKEVTEDLISPRELSNRHNLTVEKIRKIVKDSGNKLPNRYKHTASSKSSSNSAPSDDVPKSVIQPGNVIKVLTPVTGGTTVTTADGATLQLPQKSVPQTIVVQRGGSGTIQLATPGSKDKNATATGSAPGYEPKLIPGKSAICKSCGTTSPDFNKCIRCKRPIPPDCKVVEDKSSKGGKAGSASSDKDNGSLRNVRILGKKRKVKESDEPECIALSSDEDNDEDDGEKSESGDKNGESGEGVDSKKTEEQLRIEQLAKEVEAIVAPGSNKLFASLACRSIRVGSYKSMPREKVHITEKAIQIRVPPTGMGMGVQRDLVTLTIKRESILKILAHFGKSMPLLFLFLDAGECDRVRKQLKMTSLKTGLWFDMSSADETMKRLTILPDKLTEENRTAITKLYGDLIEELDSKHANEILVKSSPKDTKIRHLQMQMTTMGGTTVLKRISGPGGTSGGLSSGGPSPGDVNVKYCQYPPTGSSSVSVTMEDYYCLEDESFLNDSVIDFYFKWLQFSGKLSDADAKRTHIFSTFFYKRLTTRPPKQKNKLHPIEDDVNKSAEEKRYERVKRWTKKVNIFEKDFIVVPINDHQHWFVAVICFPGLEGCVRVDNNEKTEVPASQVKATEAQTLRRKKRKAGGAGSTPTKRVLQIGSTSIIPLQHASKLSLNLDDDSDRDEAEASDDDLLDEETEHFLLRKAREAKEAAAAAEKLKQKEAAKKETEAKGENAEEGGKEQSSGAAGQEDSVGKKTEEGTEGEDIIKKAKSAEEISPKSEAPSPADEKTLEEIIKVKQPCILIFDSLQTGSRAKVAATLRDWLKCEYKNWSANLVKEGKPAVKPRDFTKDNMRGCCPKVPQQPNFSDCGVFLLQYIESFFEKPLPDYSLPITSLKQWFPKDVVKNKRSRIAKIIRDLAGEQHPDKKFMFPELIFSMQGSGYSDDEDDDDDDIPLSQRVAGSATGLKAVTHAKSGSGRSSPMGEGGGGRQGDSKDDDVDREEGMEEMEEPTDNDGAPPLVQSFRRDKIEDPAEDNNEDHDEHHDEDGDDNDMFDLEDDIPAQTVRAPSTGGSGGLVRPPPSSSVPSQLSHPTRIQLTASPGPSGSGSGAVKTGSPPPGSSSRVVRIDPTGVAPAPQLQSASPKNKSLIVPRLTSSAASGTSKPSNGTDDATVDSAPQTSPDSTSHTLPKDTKLKSGEVDHAGDTQDPSVDSSEDTSETKKRSHEALADKPFSSGNVAANSRGDTSPKRQKVDPALET